MSRDIENLEGLGAEVAAALGSGPSEERRILQRRDFLTVITEERTSHRAWYVAAAGIAAVVALGIALYFNRPGPSQLRFFVGSEHVAGVEGQWLRTKNGEFPIHFEGGSTFSLDTGAAARMVRSDKEEVRLDLADGKVRCNINKGSGTRWQVAAGPYLVTVTGTIFDADWDSSDAVLIVDVRRGSVLVTGADLSEHGVRLARGDRLRVDTEQAVISQPGEHTKDSVEGNRGEARDEARDISGDENGMETALPRLKPNNRTGAHSGGGRDRSRDPAEMGLSELWKAANKARFRRDAATTEEMLMTLKARFPKSREADAATFLMGRVQLELRGDAAGSVTWFKRYLRETPNGPLAEEALGRIVDAYKRAGKTPLARRYAEKYLAKYGDGLFADLAKSVLSL